MIHYIQEVKHKLPERVKMFGVTRLGTTLDGISSTQYCNNT
ncbi:hypothetical protein LILY_36 [Bacteriophage Lily]|uniref:Uncharacterized protein n=1 Tax=Bacteriophage Lily TaxID=1589751 RepID=A0A0C5AN11_9CAUD|nr:hypothetical protein AVV24_gp36 [Bacteriophage Lily]AJK27760.1 hypothetical protein LILY_36 [Bacteriophage Lily]